MNAIERVRRRLQEDEHDPEVQLHELLLDINEQIVAQMRSASIRRTDLAERLGTSRAFVTKLLDGNENLTLKTLVRVANALEMRTNVDLQPRTRSKRRNLAGPTGKRSPSAAVAARTRPAAATSRRPRTNIAVRTRAPRGGR